MQRHPLQATIVAIANLPFLPSTIRGRFLRVAGLRTVGRARIHRGVVVQGPGTVTVGDRCFVNHGAFFDVAAEITLGDRVYLGDHVRILTSSHEIGTADCRAGAATASRVTVGPGTWIGSGSVVMPGVSIGSGCVIGANSLVTKDCETDMLYLGSPARPVRSLGAAVAPDLSPPS